MDSNYTAALLVMMFRLSSTLCIQITAGEVYIDDNNATIINGKPFFPLGLYVGHAPPTSKAFDVLEKVADSPFNTILNYQINEGSISQIRRYLDAANQNGLKVIYSIKDFYQGTKYYPRRVGRYSGEEGMTRGVIGEFKSHPAILAWYLNDELPSKYIPRLTKRYKLVKQLDSTHPTWIAIFQVKELKDYLKTTDVMGTDPYPIPDRPITMVSEWTKMTRQAAGPKRAIWMVPQLHNAGIYRKDNRDYQSPTLDEVRNMTYQSLIHGANGLIFYSFFDLERDPEGFEKRWAEVKKVGEEIKTLTPILLSTAEPPRVQLSSGARNINFFARQYDGKLYILAVNISREKQDAEFTISASAKKADVLFENRSLPITTFRLKDEFRPLAVHVYVVN